MRTLIAVLALATGSFGVARWATVSSRPEGSRAPGITTASAPGAAAKALAHVRGERGARALAALAAAGPPRADEGHDLVPVPETLSVLQEQIAGATSPEVKRAAWRIRTDLVLFIDRHIASCWSDIFEPVIVFELQANLRVSGQEAWLTGGRLGRVRSQSFLPEADRSCIQARLASPLKIPLREQTPPELASLAGEETLELRSLCPSCFGPRPAR